MKCLVAALLLVGLLAVSDLAFARPECGSGGSVHINSVIQVQVHVECPPSSSSSDPGSLQQVSASQTVDEPCVLEALQALMDPVEFCDTPPDPGEGQEELTPGLVAAAFQSIPLPPSELQVQPANGRTLVNFATNFYTETGPFDRTVTLLGQRVDLHIVPSEFGWRFGDGTVLATDDAGSPYPHLDVTHTYRRKGEVAPAVDTTYTATYRVEGGPWAPVPGSVTIPGPPVGLEVLTATPVLVGS